MNEKFAKLDQGKQQQIMKAAYREFTKETYKKASTNRIVEEAEIGKGMLFYYFKSKQQLFLYLLERSLTAAERYIAEIDWSLPDVISRYEQASRKKLESFLEDPESFYFLGSILLHDLGPLPESKREQIMRMQRETKEKMFSGIDYSLFRDDVDPETALKLILWSINGYEEELMARLKGEAFHLIDMNPYWEEFHHYLQTLRIVYYKGGD
ncbi:TetR/AcrR family transcriptional regulator [Bacillus daqingensis]|uniref:TetR/AcrR family transcriptional regulator n=1 Tax=Bacillus daqingensis TaxID=872396 RepID=A0ABV9NX20_9BACI